MPKKKAEDEKKPPVVTSQQTNQVTPVPPVSTVDEENKNVEQNQESTDSAAQEIEKTDGDGTVEGAAENTVENKNQEKEEKLPEKVEDVDDEDEPIVKSGFERIRIRAVCDDGKPFRGGYSSLYFDDKGEAEINQNDVETVGKLQNQFPTLEIKQA